MKRSPIALGVILAALAVVALPGAPGLAAVDTVDTKMLTQPAVSAERVVFVYANDLWTADLEGRNVRRLTSDEGVEAYPAFAPDGYHLTANSAAINKGVYAGILVDIDNEARPDGCISDIGADEFITGLECKHVYLPLVLRLFQ